MKKILCILIIMFLNFHLFAQESPVDEKIDESKSEEIEKNTDISSDMEKEDKDFVEDEGKADEGLFEAIDNIEKNENEEEENLIAEQKLKKLYGRIIYINEKILILKNKDVEYTVYLDDYTGNDLEICQVVNIFYVLEKTNILLQKYEIVKPSTCYVK